MKDWKRSGRHRDTIKEREVETVQIFSFPDRICEISEFFLLQIDSARYPIRRENNG